MDDNKKSMERRRPEGAKRPVSPSGGAPSGGESDSSERIAKRLARAGISSRREAEALIAAGRVRVNGTVLSSPAFNVAPQDRIEVDGTPIPAIERTRLFLFHKPAGVVTTNRDPQGRRTVFDCLPSDLPRLMTVGRLDINTEGLLLLTNDGGLARVLELPSTGWLRRYRVRVHGHVEAEALAGLREGIAVGGVFYGAVEATLDREQGSNAWLTIGLREGKNREVKNILGALGLEVTRLIRVSYGPFQLGELGEGEVLELKGRLLRDQLGERLISEAGADFEAAVVRPFSNKPVLASREEVEKRPSRSPQPRVEEGGLIRNRKRTRERQREDALDRLQTTRPPRFEKKRPDDRERSQDRGRSQDKGRPEDKKRDAPARARASNVWMAPGARPVGKKKAEETPAPHPSSDRPQRPHADRPNRRTAPAGKPDERRDRPRPPREEGRASGPGDKPERYRSTGKPSGGRPEGKPWAGRPSGKSGAGRPAGKPSGGRPGGKPEGSRPGGDRLGGSRPEGSSRSGAPRRESGRPGGSKPGAGGFRGGSGSGSGSGFGGRPAPRGGPRRPPKKS